MTTFQEAWAAWPTLPPTAADRAAVEACVRDYYQSWYEGDAERMGRALHPSLVKRSFGQGPDRALELTDATWGDMVEATRQGMGVPRTGERLDIHMCEIGAGIASVIAHADHYVDHLQLIETPGGWKIIHAVWRWADGHGPRA